MEITVKDNKIALKKDYLTNGEVAQIVKIALGIYNQPEDIDGYDYSPISMITNFYALLFDFCIEDYDLDKTEDYDKYYNMGAQYELLRVVTNADEAYHLMMSLSKQISSLENIIDKNLKNVVEMISNKLPDAKAMAKMVNKLPKEWQKVVNEYNEIVGKTTIEEDE
ncbi:MAG: hypothetical protein ACI4OP_01975 [Candidatus Coprovivens sp.]